MEKAKQYAKTVHESIMSEKDPSIWEKHMDGLKPKINDLLQMYLPGHITI